MCEKFHYDWLRNERALGNEKSYNNNKKNKNKNNVRGHWAKNYECVIVQVTKRALILA